MKEMWHRDPKRRPLQVAYRYEDQHGQSHQGYSMDLLPEMVEGLRTGDVREVRYDPNNPADSLWVGDEIGDDKE